MSYPVDLPDSPQGYSLGINGSRGKHGFEYGGNFYLFLAQDNQDSTPDGDWKIHALKSTDLGLTWSDMDSSNAVDAFPDTGPIANLADTYTVARDGDTAWVIVVRTSGTPIAPSIDGLQVTAFDLSTDTWGTPNDFAAPVLDFMNDSGRQLMLELCVIEPSNYQLMYSGTRESVSGSDRGRVYIASFDGSTFGTGVALPDQSGDAINYSGVSSVADSGLRAHFFYTSNESGSIGSPLYHVALDSDGTTFGSTAKVTDDLYWIGGGGGSTFPNGQCSEAIVAKIGGSNKIAIACEINDDVSSTTQSLRVFYATPALNPTWSNTIAVQGVDGDADLPIWNAAYWNAAFITLGYANDNLIVAWPYADDRDAPTVSQYNYVTSPSSGFSWSARAELFATSLPDNTATSVISFTATGGVGVAGLSFRVSTSSDFLGQFFFVPFTAATFGNCWSGAVVTHPGNI